jgi:lysophospholipase L1-like esterase
MGGFVVSRRGVLGASIAAPAGALLAAGDPANVAMADPGLAPTPPVSPNGNYLIHCLGDSLTEGVDSSDNNGYRKILRDWLFDQNETHNLQMVGSRVSGSANLNHDGWGGKTIAFLTGLVQQGYLSNPAAAKAGPPQFVIVQGGANDAGAGRTPEQMLADIGALLDAILAVSPDIRIVLGEQVLMSGLISHTLSNNTRVQQVFNAGLPAAVGARDASRIVIAKLGIITQAHLSPGGVHPNDTGYRMVAWLLYQALAPWLGWRGYMVNVDCPFGFIPRGHLTTHE